VIEQCLPFVLTEGDRQLNDLSNHEKSDFLTGGVAASSKPLPGYGLLSDVPPATTKLGEQEEEFVTPQDQAQQGQNTNTHLEG
jgi:hypothetical protein